MAIFQESQLLTGAILEESTGEAEIGPTMLVSLSLPCLGIWNEKDLHGQL